MFNRYHLMLTHMLLGSFFLPLAIIYVLSGALYTVDVKGHVDKQTFTLALNEPFTPDIEQLTRVTAQALGERQLPVPSGEPVLRGKNGSYQLRWGDLAHLVTVVPGDDRRSVKVTARKRSPLTQIMRIHRAEAGVMFKVLAVMLAAGLLVLFVTGGWMAYAIPKMRRPFILGTATGLVSVLLLLLI